MRALLLMPLLALAACGGSDDETLDSDVEADTDTDTDSDADTDTDMDTGPVPEPYSVSFEGLSNAYWFGDVYTYGDPRTWTFELWVNPDTLSSEVRVLEWLNGGPGDGRTSRAYWVVDLTAAGNVQIESVSAGSGPERTGLLVVESTGTVPVGAWTHVAIVIDSATSTVAFYLDGVSAGSTTVSGDWWTLPIATSHHLASAAAAR